ncbi:MAG TPA: hypothetical protein VGX71_05375 [Pseudaminobacter sp.]|nr:hypothetical protein [Pseudaminobacter sp.]
MTDELASKRYRAWVLDSAGRRRSDIAYFDEVSDLQQVQPGGTSWLWYVEDNPHFRAPSEPTKH